MWTDIFAGVILLNCLTLIIAERIKNAKMSPKERREEEIRNDLERGMNDPW